MTLHFLPQLVLVEVLVLGGVLFGWLQNFEQNPSSIMVSLGSPGPRRNCAVALVILWQLNSRRLKHVLNARSQVFRRHDDDDEVFFFENVFLVFIGLGRILPGVVFSLLYASSTRCALVKSFLEAENERI